MASLFSFSFSIQNYSSLRNRRVLIFDFFQALRSYWRVHKGYLDGYLLHRTCLLKALRLLFLPNFPGRMFIPCPTSISEARVFVISKNIKIPFIRLQKDTQKARKCHTYLIENAQ